MEHGTDAAELDALLRRAAVIVRHHRYHRQPLDADAIVERVLETSARRPEERSRYRGAVGQIVAVLIHRWR